MNEDDRTCDAVVSLSAARGPDMGIEHVILRLVTFDRRNEPRFGDFRCFQRSHQWRSSRLKWGVALDLGFLGQGSPALVGSLRVGAGRLFFRSWTVP